MIDGSTYVRGQKLVCVTNSYSHEHTGIIDDLLDLFRLLKQMPEPFFAAPEELLGKYDMQLFRLENYVGFTSDGGNVMVR